MWSDDPFPFILGVIFLPWWQRLSQFLSSKKNLLPFLTREKQYYRFFSNLTLFCCPFVVPAFLTLGTIDLPPQLSVSWIKQKHGNGLLLLPTKICVYVFHRYKNYFKKRMKTIIALLYRSQSNGSVPGPIAFVSNNSNSSWLYTPPNF